MAVPSAVVNREPRELSHDWQMNTFALTGLSRATKGSLEHCYHLHRLTLPRLSAN